MSFSNMKQSPKITASKRCIFHFLILLIFACPFQLKSYSKSILKAEFDAQQNKNASVDSLIILYRAMNTKDKAARYAFMIGEHYWFQRQTPEAETWLLASLKNESVPNNSNDVVNTCSLLANLYHHTGKFEKASYYASLATEKIGLITNKRLLGNIYEIKGRINHSIGKSEQSLRYFMKADSVNTISPYAEIRQLSVYVKLIIADCFEGQGQRAKAKEYLDNAYCDALEFNNDTQKNVCLQALATWYIQDGKLEKAEGIYKDQIKIIKSPSALLYSYQGLGNISFLQKKYDDAIINFKKTISIAKSTNELYMLDVFYGDLSKSYYAQNDLRLASIYIDSSIFHKGSNLSNKLSAYHLKAKILASLKDYKGSYEALYTRNTIQDSLNRRNVAELTNKLDAAYKAKEKDETISRLEDDNNLAREVNYKDRIIKYLLSIILLLIAASFMITIRQMKRRKLIDEQNAIMAEQSRISADLHDDIGSTLSSISIYSELASKFYTSEPVKAQDMIQKISGHSRDLMERMEDIIWSLKSVDQESISIKNRITQYTKDSFAESTISIDIEIDDMVNVIMISNKMRKNLLLVSKEALHNIAKYSNATAMKISMGVDNNTIAFEISDNGVGFDSANSKKGNGLINIKKRIIEMNGNVEIISSLGHGVKIKGNLPLPSISYKSK